MKRSNNDAAILDQDVASEQPVAQETLDSLLGYNIRRASALIMSEFVASFADVAMRPVSFSALALIGERPGISSAELCRRLGLQRANIVPLLADLDGRGFVKRRSHKTDRRVQLLDLTKKGRHALDELWVRVKLYEDHLFRRLSSDEKEVALEILRKVWITESDDG